MNRKRVLIVDDDNEFANAMALRCRGIGVETETARNTLTAIEIISARPPDVICIDVEMPTGDGLSVCAFLGAHPALAKRPVIILTGRCDKSTMRRCSELGASYVHKSPQVWPRLRAVICALLDLDPDGQEPPSRDQRFDAAATNGHVPAGASRV